MSKLILYNDEICVPWTEKYRPKTTEHIVQQSNLKKLIDDAQITGKLPHLLFHGPPGCGKTTTAFSICRQYFYSSTRSKAENKTIFTERVLELNASDERGIHVVKGKIKTFAEKTIGRRPGIPNIKLIILDECDAMTSDSQSALRRTMEDYMIDTRFILICNNIAQINAPIISRTLSIKYAYIDVNHMDTVINKIALHENLTISNDFLQRLHTVTNGDMRKAINLLEQVNLMFGIYTVDNLNICAGMLDTSFFQNITNTLSNSLLCAVDILDLVKLFINEAYSLPSLVFDLTHYVSTHGFDTECHMKLMDILVKVDSMIHYKASEPIILMYLFTSFHDIITNTTSDAE